MTHFISWVWIIMLGLTASLIAAAWLLPGSAVADLMMELTFALMTGKVLLQVVAGTTAIYFGHRDYSANFRQLPRVTLGVLMATLAFGIPLLSSSFADITMGCANERHASECYSQMYGAYWDGLPSASISLILDAMMMTVRLIFAYIWVGVGMAFLRQISPSPA